MRFLMSGESHGKQLTAIIDGVPAGLTISVNEINEDLRQRQSGYGRGGRMKIESDTVQIVSGVRHGQTLGSPITLVIENKDFENHRELMSVEPVAGYDVPTKTVPRPGHADLVGAIKYGHRDLQNVLERSSARDTAIRVAVGSIAKQILSEIGIELLGHVTRIGEVNIEVRNESIANIKAAVESSPVRCLDQTISKNMCALIDEVKIDGDTLGGMAQVIVEGIPAGIGSYVHYDRKLDAKITAAMMSVQTVKGVYFGDAMTASPLRGSASHDGIFRDDDGFSRTSNHYGGFEGGMTNGMPLVATAICKPIPTLYKPLNSVCLSTYEVRDGIVERSDTCAIPALSVILESVIATELAREILDTFHADTMPQLKEGFESFRGDVKNF